MEFFQPILEEYFYFSSVGNFAPFILTAVPFRRKRFSSLPLEGKVPSVARRMRWNALLSPTLQTGNRSIHPANKEKTADFLRLLCRLHLISRLTAPASPSREALNGVKPKAN